MRTNIDIDDQLMADVLAASGIVTKRAAVDAALRSFLMLSKQAEVRQLRGKIEWIGDLDDMRTDR